VVVLPEAFESRAAAASLAGNKQQALHSQSVKHGACLCARRVPRHSAVNIKAFVLCAELAMPRSLLVFIYGCEQNSIFVRW
jgi:hypothetical protein